MFWLGLLFTAWIVIGAFTIVGLFTFDKKERRQFMYDNINQKMLTMTLVVILWPVIYHHHWKTNDLNTD